MSLKKIAEQTGASVSTVSRVLNQPGYRCSDPALAARIREAARETGYVPNANAKKLRAGAHPDDPVYSVDVLLARFQSLSDDAFFEEVYQCLETEFLKRQCRLNRVLTAPDIAQMEAGKDYSRSVGVVILGKCPSALSAVIQKRYLAVAAIDRNPTVYEMDEVVCDGAKAAATVIEYFYGLGHRRIAYIGDCRVEARYTGYYESMLKYRLPLNYDYVVSTGQTGKEGYQAYEKLSRITNPPTAVFCANDVTALGFLQAMREKNGRKRKEVYRPAVASIDDIAAACECRPMLTTVHIPKEDMAHIAVMLLRDRLMGGHRENVRVELPCRLMIRESSGIQI